MGVATSKVTGNAAGGGHERGLKGCHTWRMRNIPVREPGGNALGYIR